MDLLRVVKCLRMTFFHSSNLLHEHASGKEHIDESMHMLRKLAGHQRHCHAETLQFNVRLWMTKTRRRVQNRAHSKQGRDETLSLKC